MTPNDHYSGRTASLTSKRCILYIYSTNIGTEYFKNGIYTPFFSSKCSFFHNSNLFGSCIIHILYTGCAKIKKNNNSGAERLNENVYEPFVLSQMLWSLCHIPGVCHCTICGTLCCRFATRDKAGPKSL